VANSLRLLKLPADIQELLKARTLSRGHARALLSAGDPAAIRKLAQKFQAESLSVRSAEEAVRPAKERRSRRDGPAEDPNVRAAQERLQKRLGTRVRVHCDTKGGGRIEIQFGSQGELSRLFDGLMSGKY
jgi:ParB family chromosome partitioning protein